MAQTAQYLQSHILAAQSLKATAAAPTVRLAAARAAESASGARRRLSQGAAARLRPPCASQAAERPRDPGWGGGSRPPWPARKCRAVGRWMRRWLHSSWATLQQRPLAAPQDGDRLCWWPPPAHSRPRAVADEQLQHRLLARRFQGPTCRRCQEHPSLDSLDQGHGDLGKVHCGLRCRRRPRDCYKLLDWAPEPPRSPPDGAWNRH